jgi:hypothetical protein
MSRAPAATRRADSRRLDRGPSRQPQEPPFPSRQPHDDRRHPRVARAGPGLRAGATHHRRHRRRHDFWRGVLSLARGRRPRIAATRRGSPITTRKSRCSTRRRRPVSASPRHHRQCMRLRLECHRPRLRADPRAAGAMRFSAAGTMRLGAGLSRVRFPPGFDAGKNPSLRRRPHRPGPGRRRGALLRPRELRTRPRSRRAHPGPRHRLRHLTDTHHITQPHPSGIGPRLAMERALASAGCAAESVDYINAHGTATRSTMPRRASPSPSSSATASRSAPPNR